MAWYKPALFASLSEIPVSKSFFLNPQTENGEEKKKKGKEKTEKKTNNMNYNKKHILPPQRLKFSCVCFLWFFFFPLPLLEWKYLEVMYMATMGSGIGFCSFVFFLFEI